MTEHNRVCAEIDLDAIAYNMEQMKKRIGDHARLIAVVKADGYGHGAVPVAGMFEACSYVWGYAVACLEEAMELREQGIRKPILVLGCVFPDQFEEMIRTYIDRTISLTQKVKSMAGSKMRGFSLDRIILVGGSTKIPAVKQMIETETGKRPAQDINPDECVAIGAALQGRIIALENGWVDDEDALLVDIPDEERGNNQYSCLTTNPKKSVTITVYDVTSQDLGVVAVIDGKEDQFSRIIEKNSKIPVKKRDEYFTNRDQQSAIHVQIIQGQDSVLYPDAQDPHNKIIFEADMNITQAARGDYAYIVTFSLDDNGILSVASDEYKTKIDAQGYLHADLSKKTTKKITFNVKLQTGLSQQEIRASQDELHKHFKDYKSQF